MQLYLKKAQCGVQEWGKAQGASGIGAALAARDWRQVAQAYSICRDKFTNILRDHGTRESEGEGVACGGERQVVNGDRV